MTDFFNRNRPSADLFRSPSPEYYEDFAWASNHSFERWITPSSSFVGSHKFSSSSSVFGNILRSPGEKVKATLERNWS